MPAILASSPFLASSSSSYDSTSASGVPFGTAILIALGATLGLLLVPLVSYAVIAHVIRRCRPSRAQRAEREHVSPGNGTIVGGGKKMNKMNKQQAVNGGSWPRPSPTSTLQDPFALAEPNGVPMSTTAGSTSPYARKSAKKEGRIARSWTMMFPKLWKMTKRGEGKVSRDCEKGIPSRKENAEEMKENIVSAFMGFLRSWARVEGMERAR